MARRIGIVYCERIQDASSGVPVHVGTHDD